MAETLVPLLVTFLDRALQQKAAAVREAVLESLRLPGARTPARLASWIKDTPELKLNLSLLVEAFLQLLASGLGTLALVWATVVLLGGFSTMLGRMDFWFTTAIVFVETARTAENILWILSNSSEEDMRMLAVEILSRLTLDEPPIIRNLFTAELRRLLLDTHQNIQLRIEAAKALIASGDEFPDIQQLVTIMSAADAAYSKEYRAVIAEMLAHICAKSTADQDTINRLSSVTNALSTVLKAIVTETTDIAELDMSNRKFLASFLGLAVQIREKLTTAEAFASAVTGLLPRMNNVFAEKLERIIETTNDSEDEICLAIMKSVTKLVTWMTELDTISPGCSIEYFRRDNIVKKLKDAVEAMAHLERYVFMTGGADENEGYETLQTLVETARNKLVSPSWQQR